MFDAAPDSVSAVFNVVASVTDHALRVSARLRLERLSLSQRMIDVDILDVTTHLDSPVADFKLGAILFVVHVAFTGILRWHRHRLRRRNSIVTVIVISFRNSRLNDGSYAYGD
jgi:hypothetical protein